MKGADAGGFIVTLLPLTLVSHLMQLGNSQDDIVAHVLFLFPTLWELFVFQNESS